MNDYFAPYGYPLLNLSYFAVNILMREPPIRHHMHQTGWGYLSMLPNDRRVIYHSLYPFGWIINEAQIGLGFRSHKTIDRF